LPKTEAVRLKPKSTAKALEQLQTAAFQAAPEASDANQQWQKDYEAFVALQRVPGPALEEEDPALVSALLVGSQSGSLGSLLGQDQRQEAAVQKQTLEEAQRREARRKKEQEEQKRLQELKERKYEDNEFQAQDRARKHHEQQIHKRLAAVPVERAPQDGVPQQTPPIDERYERWRKEPRSPVSVLDLSRLRSFRNQQETVKAITREVESKHRPLFDVVQDLQSQQQEQVEIRRPVEGGRFERWHGHKLRRKAMLQEDTRAAAVHELPEEKETAREKQLLQLQRRIEAKDYEEAPHRLGRAQKQRGEHFETWKKLHFHRR